MDKGTCSVNGCERPSHKRGWCSGHYQRWLSNGDLGSVEVRAKIKRQGNCVIDECDRPAFKRGMCSLHYVRWQKHGDPLREPTRLTLAERFWLKTDKTDGCWVWKASLRDGYGVFAVDGQARPAHRVAYELLVGLVPEGLVLDHLCRNRACVNPAHLEPVTDKVNILRGESVSAKNRVKTHCLRGHEFTPENTRVYNGGRWCIACAPVRRDLARST